MQIVKWEMCFKELMSILLITIERLRKAASTSVRTSATFKWRRACYAPRNDSKTNLEDPNHIFGAMIKKSFPKDSKKKTICVLFE